ncbi:MAG TPA: MarR family transcriptional regulator [Ktedonobacteraceae bacterium]|nr:MarR family transcriptional regulator [Ktedonobacteraceae bacterium]
MTEKIDEFHLAAWRAFLNTHAVVIERIEREMAEAKQLPLSSYDVLLTLLEAPQHQLRMHEIADAVVLSRSGLTRLIDRLEAQGLLVRERSSSDRRGAYAVLTPKGVEALRQAWPVYAKGIEQHFTSLLNDTEVRILTEALERVLAAAREIPTLQHTTTP